MSNEEICAHPLFPLFPVHLQISVTYILLLLHCQVLEHLYSPLYYTYRVCRLILKIEINKQHDCEYITPWGTT